MTVVWQVNIMMQRPHFDKYGVLVERLWWLDGWLVGRRSIALIWIYQEIGEGRSVMIRGSC
jgi:hypothetical protein